MDVHVNNPSDNYQHVGTNIEVVNQILLKSHCIIVWNTRVDNSPIKVIGHLVETIAGPADLVPNELSLALLLLVYFELNVLPP